MSRNNSNGAQAHTNPKRGGEIKMLALGANGATIFDVKLMGAAVASKKILVVDDEPFVCDAVKMMLAFDGHDVQTANSGKEALTIFEKGKFDLIITDFAMPVMKGDELAATIKAKAPDQPIVMITAYAEMLQSSGNPLTGVDSIISKPFLLEDLRAAMTKVLGEKKSAN
jgi:CheY-like chemotaxis protein